MSLKEKPRRNHPNGKLFPVFFLIFLITAICNGNTSADSAATSVHHISFYRNPSKVPAYRLKTPVHLDGRLIEGVWQQPGVTGLTQQNPDEGEPATENTVVWVAYDDEALYVAARLFDHAPDSIIARLGRRDQQLASDFMGIAIDSYHDKQTGFFFWVTPAGSFGDGTISNDSDFDDTWNGVWDYGVRIDSLGWCVEMRIPFSQLRFTEREEYEWGFNVLRFIQRKQERDFLVLIPRDSNREVSLYPSLVGIRNIHPPRRVEVMPYLVSSERFLHYDANDPFGRNRSFVGNLGADIKFGIGSNLTVDATINPDFGQVELDPAVVNLTAFETFFEEKRPFFVEGANIFSFGNRGVTSSWTFNYNPPLFFYSRRIGRVPQGQPVHDGAVNMPANTTIMTAGKLTGKTKHHWEIALLQAVTAREFATVDSQGVRFKDEVEPLSSYTVARVFKNFKESRAGVGFIGTGVVRQLRNPALRRSLLRNAFTGGMDGYLLLGKERNWALNGWIGASGISGSREALTDLQEAPQHYYQRPDFRFRQLDSTRTSLSGWAGRVILNKEKGNFFLNAALGVISPGFDTNELGFHSRGNVINQHLVLGYRWFEPGKVFRNVGWFAANFRTFDFDGNKTSEGFMSFFHGQLLNYAGLFGRAGYFLKTLDITRTRGGPIMENPPGFFVGFAASSDSRKDFRVRVSVDYGASQPGGWQYKTGVRFQWRPGTQMQLSLRPQFFRDHTIAQYVTTVPDEAASHTFGKRYVFAILDQKQISASLRLNYTFSPTLSFQMFLQPLIAAGKYRDFKELARPRTFDFVHYGQNGTTISRFDDYYEVDPDGSGQHRFEIDNPDFNFKSLRGTAVLRWEFAPGSTFFFVWTHDRSAVENQGVFNIGRDFGNLLKASSDNVFLLKLTYWWNP